MKKLLLASALLALTAAPVMADEAQDTAPEPVEYEAQDTGSKGVFYGGLQAMYAMQWIKKGNAKQDKARKHMADAKGFGGGVFLGYGHVFNRFYLGGELAYAYGAVNAKKASTFQPRLQGEVKTQLKHFVDFAIHPGVVLPHGFTPYGIVGLRYVHGNVDIKPRGGQKLSKTVHGVGPRLGAGLKWKPSPSPFFVGVEAAWSPIKMKMKKFAYLDGVKTNNVDVKVKVGYQF